MPRAAFDDLVSVLGPKLEENTVKEGRHSSVFQSIRSCGSAGLITTNLKVSMALRWLAGGCYLDIAAHHGVSFTLFWRARDYVLAAIINSDAASLQIAFPDLDDEQSLEALARGFREKAEEGVFHNVVGALDGLMIELQYICNTCSQASVLTIEIVVKEFATDCRCRPHENHLHHRHRYPLPPASHRNLRLLDHRRPHPHHHPHFAHFRLLAIGHLVLVVWNYDLVLGTDDFLLYAE
mmetsp:Transcript_24118/g.48725  ORF Transcript_24118/g.48725 Transcript_24118/m.48725 type:complete len:237 (-) Transcript_24118:333-1043(-)